MPTFIYKAKNKPDSIIDGRIEAENEESAISKLNQAGLFPLEVREEGPQDAKQYRGPSLSFFHKVRPQDTVVFTRQLADLLDSGLTLIRSLEVVSNQTPNKYLKVILAEVHDFVRDGGSFSEGLGKHSSVFSSLYVNMIRTGELSGNLDKVLNRLADFYENEQEVRSKVSMSLLYPAMVILFGIATVFILLTFVIPKLTIMFVDLGQTLPLPTLALINISAFFSRFWWLLIIIAGLLAIYFERINSSSEGKYIIDRLKLKIPIFGEFIRKVEISRFGRTLGTLLDSGVTIIESMQTVSFVLENDIFRKDTKRMAQEIIDGSSLTNSMSKSACFPEAVVNMVAIGEESGQLDKSLLKIAESYERQADRGVKLITTVLGPVLIVIVGLIVLFIVIAMILPILQMNMISY